MDLHLPLTLLLLLPVTWECDPPLSDLGRFPPPAVVADQLGLARRHQQWVRERYSACPSPFDGHWFAWLQQAYRCARPWELLRDAQDEKVMDGDRRRWLARLRDDLGAERYYAGRLDAPVPLWRFRWRE